MKMSEPMTMREFLTGYVQPRTRGADMKQLLPKYPYLFFDPNARELYKKALEFGETIRSTPAGKDALESLDRMFERLEQIRVNYEKLELIVEIFVDHAAEYSFYFNMWKFADWEGNKIPEGEIWMNGGIILHGFGSGDHWNIQLVPEKGKIYWSTHT